MQRHDFVLATDRQVDLTDSDEVPEDSWEESCHITEEDLLHHIKIVPGIIKVFTERSGQTSFSVEVHEEEPSSDFTAWDHVVDVSLHLHSELLVITGLWTAFEDVIRIPLSSGSYRVRLQCANLDFYSNPDGSIGQDHYLVRFWSCAPAPLVVLKQYTPGRGPAA